jgi:hypothetical protein
MLLTERYQDKIHGVISCYDRVIIQGTLPELCYARGRSGFLTRRGFRIFDYSRFAEPLRNALRENAAALASEQGVEIEFVRQSKLQRKEKRIAAVIAQRGPQPCLVHILSAMEACSSYKPGTSRPRMKLCLSLTPLAPRDSYFQLRPVIPVVYEK